MSSDSIAVSNALGIKENSIEEVTINFISNLECLATMEQKWDIELLCLALAAEV